MDSFMYALKSSEARRQYPKRLKLFFDFIGVGGTLPEQASNFLARLKKVLQNSKTFFSFFSFT